MRNVLSCKKTHFLRDKLQNVPFALKVLTQKSSLEERFESVHFAIKLSGVCLYSPAPTA
jgi:hypothetical protein